jgi:2-oxoglutarate ferredoxin oxidoreductase subunit gamma
MEWDLYISGTGGQGIQLAAKILGLAAMADGCEVMLTSEYGGEMRGGPSRASISIARGAMHALPVLASAGSAIAMHHLHWARTADRLRKGALILADTATAKEIALDASWKLVPVPASDIAREAGNIMAACMAIMSAYAALTHIVDADALIAAMKSLVPAYRRQHLEVNEFAIRAGYDWAQTRAAA